jgi:hypothetical protein
VACHEQLNIAEKVRDGGRGGYADCLGYYHSNFFSPIKVEFRVEFTDLEIGVNSVVGKCPGKGETSGAEITPGLGVFRG